MASPLRPAAIDWSQGAPFSPEFGDVYFSREGGAAETAHVFLAQNHLSERFAAQRTGNAFTLVETGFGTGLNWLATMDLWQRRSGGGWLHFVSVEGAPLTQADLCRAHACWPGLAAPAAALQRVYPPLVPGFHRLVFPEWRATLTLFFGNLADFLPRLVATVDAWFLDGFAPARNPQMWTPALYEGMARLSRTDATFATFTSAGEVRRGLAAAGFRIEKVPGHGRKREMLRGVFAGASPTRATASPWFQRPSAVAAERRACVIGAGIAGAETAARLARRGWQVTVLERERPGAGGSGNPAAVLYPRLAPPALALDHFRQAAWLFALRELGRLPADDSPWHPCGLLQLLTGNRARELAEADAVQAGLVQRLSASEAGRHAGLPLSRDALWYPQAGWLAPAPYLRRLLETPGVTLQTAEVARLEPTGHGWRVTSPEGKTLLECPVVIVATAYAARTLAPLSTLPLQAVRGQVSLAPATSATRHLSSLICHDGYLTPPLPDGRHCLGATFQPGRADTQADAADHAANLAQLQAVLPEVAAGLGESTAWEGRASVRCQSPDYLPLVGPVPDRDAFLAAYDGLRDGRVQDYPDLPALSGLYVNLAHGAKGFGQAALAAEILAADLGGEPYPVSLKVLEALHPARFWVRELRRGKADKQKSRQAPA